MDTPRYNPPEGFEYDPKSGYYINKIPAEDENGRRVMVVTRFDDITGKYAQKVFPMDSRQQSDSANKVRTQQSINPANRTQSGQSIKPAGRVQSGNRKKSAGINRLTIIIVCIVAALAIIGVILWVILRQKGDAASSEGKDGASISEDYDSNDELGADAEANLEVDTSEKEVVFEGDLTSTYSWPDIPSVSIYNNTADEDETYVYTLNCSEPSFEKNNGCPRGTIVRFNKDGNWDGAEVLYDGSQGDAYAVSVMGDYMYYSIYNGSEYEYRRMHKETCEDSLMFKEDYSFISCYDGYVCCLFTRGGRHEMLRYRTNEYGESTAEYLDVFENMGQFSDATLVIPFCIYDRTLYFSGYNSSDTFVATFDPDTHEAQTLTVTQDMAEFEEDASGGGMFAGMYSRNQGFVENYGFNPPILPDGTVGIDSSNCITQHALLANMRGVSYMGYEDGTVRGAFGRLNEKGLYAPEEDEEYNDIYSFNDELVFPNETYLVGTSENWIILNGYALLTDGYDILMQKSF